MKKIKNKISALILLLTLYFSPLVTFAAYCTGVGGTVNLSGGNVSIAKLLDWGTCLISGSVVPLMYTIATLVFLWGVINFIKEDKAEEKEKGKQFMIWGIIGFTVMLGVWGFVSILGSSIGVTNVVPQLPVNSN